MTTLAERLGKIWGDISKPVKVAFFAALVAGFITHLPMIANRLFNHDSLTYLLADPNSTVALSQGKWLSLPMNLLLRGNLASTGIIIPLGILFLALTAAVAVSVLNIKSGLWAGIIGAIHVLFPSVMSANTFYASALFFFALLLAALSVLFTVRFRWGFLAGVVLLTLSCGIYSAFIGYAAGLFLLHALMELLENDRNTGKILLSGVKYLLVLAVSAALSYVVLQIILSFTNVDLSIYRGISTVGKFRLSSLGIYVFRAYRKVFYFLIHGIFLYLSSFQVGSMFRVLNWCVLALSAALTIGFAWKTGVYRKPGKVLLSLLLIGLFPLAIHAIAILGKNAYTHWIMCYPFVLIYVFPVLFADRLEQRAKQPKAAERPASAIGRVALRTGALCVLAVSLLLFRQWFFVSNQGYDFLRLADQNAISAGTMLALDLRNTQGYSATSPVVFAGTDSPEVFQYTTGQFAQVAGQNGDGYTGLRLPVTDMNHLKILLQNYVGVSVAYADEETTTRLLYSDAVAAMPIYPAAGSIEWVENCLVVKLSAVSSGADATDTAATTGD